MIHTYSQFGCPGDFFKCESDKKIKIVIDPPKSYFNNSLMVDRSNYEKIVIIQGMEPKELNYISNEIIQNKSYFDKILTSFPDVLSECENSELFLYASCWILTKNDYSRANYQEEYSNIFTTKKNFELSCVMSQKNFLPGHNLRHNCKDIIRKKRKYDLYFPESIPMEEKFKLFQNSMFHIAIENTQNINYISEKIIDCFMSYTIPLYWGCPNISDYFNIDGIICFNTKEELENILDNLSEDEYYRRMGAVLENYRISFENYAFYSDRVNNKLKQLF